MDIKYELAEFLIKSNAIRFGLFKLSSGKSSPYYLDLRIIPSFPSYFKFIVDALKEKLDKIKGDYLCAIPTSGLVYASALSYASSKPLVYVRKESKEYGTSKLIEGYLKPGSEIIIIDDVITSGRSIINTAEIIRRNGALVNNVITIIDRLEGGRDALSKVSMNLFSLVTIKEIVNILYDNNMINEDIFTTINEQISS